MHQKSIHCRRFLYPKQSAVQREMACRVKDVLATPSMSRQRPSMAEMHLEFGWGKEQTRPRGIDCQTCVWEPSGQTEMSRHAKKADRGNRAHYRNDKPLRPAGHRSLMSRERQQRAFAIIVRFVSATGGAVMLVVKAQSAHIGYHARWAHQRLGERSKSKMFCVASATAPRAHELGTQSGTSSDLVKKANSSIVLRIGARSASPNSTASPPPPMISGSNKLTMSAWWRPIREPQSDSIESAMSSLCSTEAANSARLVV